MKKNKTVAIIPTKNEENAIGSVIKETKRYVDEIIVIDGNSKDKTVKIARKYGAKIFHGEGNGKGNDFSKFLKEYKIKSNNLYIMLDGDGSYSPNYIPLFVKSLKNYEVVSGKRANLISNNFLHCIGNKIISSAGFLLFGKYTDICTGMWGFRGEILKKLEISAKGFELEANIFTNIVKLNLKHKEIKIKCSKRIGKKKLKKIDGLRILCFLFKEKLKDIKTYAPKILW